MSRNNLFGRFYEAGGPVANLTFGEAVDHLGLNNVPSDVETKLRGMAADSPDAWNLPFSDPRSTKAFFLLIKRFKLGAVGDYKNLYATERYLSSVPQEQAADWTKLQKVITLLKEVMDNNNSNLNVGLVEEIKEYLPQVVYQDLLQRASTSDVDKKLGDISGGTPPAPPADSDNENAEDIARLEQELKDLNGLLELLDDEPEEKAKIEKEIVDVSSLLEMLRDM